ncbi:hypothetical protein KIN20_037199 [Parelaphostrongylus tenuis]|uniref:Uncharacterized protein n=1 Tax=Parelaphostrongylus tenuis TaxID=148309 RepID=A0AAD5WM95_PARTN|nr:hypothetical protein KIN20_037199 [Parelaphostrongylus tenuis]
MRGERQQCRRKQVPLTIGRTPLHGDDDDDEIPRTKMCISNVPPSSKTLNRKEVKGRLSLRASSRRILAVVWRRVRSTLGVVVVQDENTSDRQNPYTWTITMISYQNISIYPMGDKRTNTLLRRRRGHRKTFSQSTSIGDKTSNDKIEQTHNHSKVPHN